MAAQAAAGKAGDNPNVMAITMVEEMLKLLVVKVDEKDVPAGTLEDLDSVFTYGEYSQLQQVINEMSGVKDGVVQAPKTESVSSGAQ